MELKQDRGLRLRVFPGGLNRTNVELKHIERELPRFAEIRLNRTNVELKPSIISCVTCRASRLNRTNVELKLNRKREYVTSGAKS